MHYFARKPFPQDNNYTNLTKREPLQPAVAYRGSGEGAVGSRAEDFLTIRRRG